MNEPSALGAPRDPNHPMHVPPCAPIVLVAMLIGIMIGAAMSAAVATVRSARRHANTDAEHARTPSPRRRDRPAAATPPSPPRHGDVVLRLVKKGE